MVQAKKWKKILYNHEQIVAATKKIATDLNAKYKNAKEVTLIGVLKGAVPFMAELIKHLTFDMRLDFITATSYKDNRPTGELKIVMDLSHSVVGHDIIIVEDICDSGVTLSRLTKYIESKNPKSIASVVLVNKPSKRKVAYEPTWYGLKVEDVFIVGFGFDDNGYLRNLPFIAECDS